MWIPTHPKGYYRGLSSLCHNLTVTDLPPSLLPPAILDPLLASFPPSLVSLVGTDHSLAKEFALAILFTRKCGIYTSVYQV